MGIHWPDGGYSAHVEIYLIVDGEKLNVAQVGPEALILREPRDLPPSTEADILIKVDEYEEVHHVVLYEGAAASAETVKFF